MVAEDLIKEYFKGGNAVSANSTELENRLKTIKEMGDKLKEERDEKRGEAKIIRPHLKPHNPAI